MNKRQELLLNLTIENYIDTAEPVGSRFLLAASGLDCGEATVRNELRALEEEGFLTHPHTSAGRIPTEQGYRFYLTQLDLGKFKLAKKDETSLHAAIQSLSGEEKIKNLVKNLAELSHSAVLFAFDLNRIYYTGLSNLFSQPEFKELNLVMNVSSMFDHCDECLEDFYERVGDLPQFYLGADHPFGEILSVLSFRHNNSLLALLGPLRMNYQKNFSLINKVKNLI